MLVKKPPIQFVNRRGLYSISKSIVSRWRAADSAVVRQGEGNNDTIALEMELANRVSYFTYSLPLAKREQVPFGTQIHSRSSRSSRDCEAQEWTLVAQSFIPALVTP